MKTWIAVLVGLALSTQTVNAQRCAETPSRTPMEGELPGAHVRVLPESPPSSGAHAFHLSARLQVRNTSGEWLTLELADYEWVHEQTTVSFQRKTLEFVGAGGQLRRGTRIALPPGFDGEVTVRGRLPAGSLIYRQLYWHQVRIRTRSGEVQVRGCGLRYRPPHRR
ncbi:MAG: hypothetical protein AAGE52_20650 [Myxococcota bacterium]